MRELIKFFAWRINRDGIGLEAAALAFTSILALIPAMTIVVSIFAMVPAFTPVKEEMLRFASENFLPVFTDAISNGISSFVSHAASMTLTGSLMLFVVSLMLIRSIDRTLNRIWRGAKRRITQTFAIYWTLLTLGPLSLGITVWATSKIVSAAIFEQEEIAVALKTFYSVLPFVIEAGMIFVLYTVLPVTTVKLQDALVGAILVAISFEISKRVFSAFILNFSDYEAIYGALAALPVLMIWIYINWWLILCGAEFTAVLGVVRGGNANNVPKLIQSLVNLLSAKEDPKEVIAKSVEAYSKYEDDYGADFDYQDHRSASRADFNSGATADSMDASNLSNSTGVGFGRGFLSFGKKKAEAPSERKKSIHVHVSPSRHNQNDKDKDKDKEKSQGADMD